MNNTQEKDLHIIYKKLGQTPKEALLKYKKDNNMSFDLRMTYAGRLDPMAEGLLLVLSGDKVMEKEKYLDLPKEYSFDVLWEFETDTADILGMSKWSDISIFPKTTEVGDYVKNSVKSFEQKYPAYSSQTAIGIDSLGKEVNKSLIEWSREGKISQIKIPSHLVEIFSAEFIDRRFITGIELLKSIEERVALVSGDFRQIQIVDKWRNLLYPKMDHSFALDKIKIKVSGGFYVRQFVSDMAEHFQTLATTYHIDRLSIGDFHI